MILFKQDWERFPTAIADTETTNTTFIRLVRLYREMGIANHAFPLALLQPELQGVNPHSPNLSTEQKLMIANECQWNPWYCIREVIRLPPQGGPAPIPYKANRGNIALMWAFFNHIDFALIQPRQTGKSASTDVLNVIIITLMGWNTRIQLVTKDHSLRRENVTRIKAIRDQLPAYLNPTSSADADNTEIVTLKTRENYYLTAVGQKSREGADNLGRGITAAIFHGDEVPYIPNVHISFPVALAAGTAARENAKAAGGLYGNIFTTTAGRKDTPEGRFAYNLVHDGYYWNENLFDEFDVAAVRKTILDNSHSDSPMINGTFNHRQLGKSDQWLAEAIANARADEDTANRDFFNIWTSGTESSPLSIQLAQVIARSERDPDYVERTALNYQIRWYIPMVQLHHEMSTKWHLIGLDSSNAIGRDNNGLVITDIYKMSVVAGMSVNEANLYRFAKWLAEFMIRYPKTILVIENKASAQGIIDTLLVKLPEVGIDPFKRIYNRVVDEKAQREDDYKLLETPLSRRNESFYMRLKSRFGFMTTGSSRAHLYDAVFHQATQTTANMVNDSVLSGELRGLITKNGRVDHPPGGHDDMVIAWLLCHYFISHSRNLEHYGLDPRECLSMVSANGATLSEEDLAKRGEQTQLRLQIDAVKQHLKVAKLPSETIRLEQQLKLLVAKTESDGGTTVSMESILEEVRDSKRRRSRLRDRLALA